MEPTNKNSITVTEDLKRLDYSHHYKSSSGFSVELDNQLITEFSTTTEEYQRHVSLIGDEMYIKESLVYSKASGELVGFCDIGDINNHLLQLEQKYQNDIHQVILWSSLR